MKLTVYVAPHDLDSHVLAGRDFIAYFTPSEEQGYVVELQVDIKRISYDGGDFVTVKRGETE